MSKAIRFRDFSYETVYETNWKKAVNDEKGLCLLVTKALGCLKNGTYETVFRPFQKGALLRRGFYVTLELSRAREDVRCYGGALDPSHFDRKSHLSENWKFEPFS